MSFYIVITNPKKFFKNIEKQNIPGRFSDQRGRGDKNRRFQPFWAKIDLLGYYFELLSVHGGSNYVSNFTSM